MSDQDPDAIAKKYGGVLLAAPGVAAAQMSSGPPPPKVSSPLGTTVQIGPSGETRTTPTDVFGNEGVLQNVPPAIAAQVRALATGRQQFPAGFALRSPYWQQMMGLVGEYDPSFDTANYNARFKTRQDFTSGQSAKQINSLNTVIGHLATLSQAADALHNRSFVPWNSVANWLSNELGYPEPKNFEATREAVADELTRVWRQAGGSESDIKERKGQLSTSGSPLQLHSVIGQIGDLLESKLDAMQNQYRQGSGINDINVVTPQARLVLDALKTRSDATPPASSGPAVGTQRTIQGVPAEWDGKGWKPTTAKKVGAPQSALETGLRDQARAILQQNNYRADDDSIDRFLAKPTNAQLLGVS